MNTPSESQDMTQFCRGDFAISWLLWPIANVHMGKFKYRQEHLFLYLTDISPQGDEYEVINVMRPKVNDTSLQFTDLERNICSIT